MSERFELLKLERQPIADSIGADPFSNLDALRIDQQFGADLGLRREAPTVRRGKPSRNEWVRRHPSPEWTITTAILHFEEDGRPDSYLVAPALRDELAADLRLVELCATITTVGSPLIWEVPVPPPSMRENSWHESRRRAAELARTRWVRVASNMSTKSYEIFTTSADIPMPQWPVASFEELLRLAYAAHYIDSLEHHVVRNLRGAI